MITEDVIQKALEHLRTGYVAVWGNLDADTDLVVQEPYEGGIEAVMTLRQIAAAFNEALQES